MEHLNNTHEHSVILAQDTHKVGASILSAPTLCV